MAQMDYALRDAGWLDEFRSRADSSVFAVEDGDDLIAFTILAGTAPADAEFRIALRADKTGLGLGESITLQSLRVGFEEQCLSRIHLIVRKNNQRGIRLYRRIGFSECGECRKEIRGAQVDFLVMEIRPGEEAR